MLGKTGAGAAEEQGVTDQIDIYFSTFAKSMALIGGFLAGQPEIIRHLKYNMRSQIFAKSLGIAADLCIYTNQQHSIEILDVQ